MNAQRHDGAPRGTIEDDPLASLCGGAAAIADLAFGSLSIGASDIAGHHLAILPIDSLEIDLTDPAQRQLGDYELLELIGEGGMGVVYRARQCSLEREVAVKLLAAGPWASQEFIERFRREAQNAARMQHPHIVAIYEVGATEELHFFSMRLVCGGSLAAALRSGGRMAPARAAQLLRTIAEAVDYAHRLGVLHLDLKPANVLLDDAGVPHVADFGLARRVEQGLATDNHEVSGTPSYMAPEQAVAGPQRITPATDIWGLGAILYELVTGEPPFLGASPQSTLDMVVASERPDPRRKVPNLPRDLAAIIGKCMTRDVAQRYASGRALADDLAAFCEGREVKARPLSAPRRAARWARREPKLAATALLAVAALLAGLSATTQQWRRAEANANTSNQRLWESRREAALRAQVDGKGFDALPGLIANVAEQERAGHAASVERREIGAILNQGVVLVNRTRLPDAEHVSPFAVDLSPDSSRFAVAMTDLTVHWYDTASLRQLGQVDLLGLPNSKDAPTTPLLLRFVDDHHLRATLEWIDFFPAPAEDDSYLIDLDQATVRTPPDNFADLASTTFSADGRLALLANHAGQTQAWSVAPWQPLSPLVDASFERETTMISVDGTHAFALGNKMTTLTQYDLRSLGNGVRIALPANDGISAWSQSNDGLHLALGDFRGRVFVVDSTTRLVRQLPTPTGREVTWIAFSEDSTWLAAARWDGAVLGFDVASGNALNAGQMQADFEVRRVAIDRQQRLLVASGLGKSALWRLPQPGPTGTSALRIATSPSRSAVAGPYSLAFNPRSGRMVSVETDGEIRVWQAPRSPVLAARAPWRVSGSLDYDGSRIVDVAYDRMRIVKTGGGDATAWIGLPQPVAFADLVDAGRSVVVGSGTQLLVLDAISMQQRLPAIELGNSPLRVATRAASGLAIVTFPQQGDAGLDERIEAFDLANGQRLGAAAIAAGPLRQFELSPDGSRLLTTGPDRGATQVFDARSLRVVGALPNAHEKPVIWAAFAAAGPIVHALARPRDPRLLGGEVIDWNPVSGALQSTRAFRTGWPISLATVAGRVFVAARDGDLLDPGMGSEIRLPSPTRDEVGAALAVSHDGKLIAHAFRYGVQLYDSASGAAVGPLLPADTRSIDVIAQLAFSPDDRQLLAITLERNWLLWSIAADDRAVSAMLRDATLYGSASFPADASPADGARAATEPWHETEPRPSPPRVYGENGVPIPARDPATSPLLLDLSRVYNTGPDSMQSQMRALIPTMDTLPIGVVTIKGVTFDIRGAIELHPDTTSEANIDFAQRSGQIDVPAVAIAAFHMLMMAGNETVASDGDILARLRIRYRDGTTAQVPLRAGTELPAGDPEDPKSAALGWVWGDHLRLMGYLPQHLISDPRLVNPHPNKLISTIELEAAENSSANPAFLAVTAEPVIAAGDSGTQRPVEPEAARLHSNARTRP